MLKTLEGYQFCMLTTHCDMCHHQEAGGGSFYTYRCRALSPELWKEGHLVFTFVFTFVQRRASLVAQRLKCLPAVRETWVQPLGWEDPLEKEMATHSSILAWRIPSMEEPGRLQSMGSQRAGHDCVTTTSLHFTFCPRVTSSKMLISGRDHLIGQAWVMGP